MRNGREWAVSGRHWILVMIYSIIRRLQFVSYSSCNEWNDYWQLCFIPRISIENDVRNTIIWIPLVKFPGILILVQYIQTDFHQKVILGQYASYAVWNGLCTSSWSNQSASLSGATIYVCCDVVGRSTAIRHVGHGLWSHTFLSSHCRASYCMPVVQCSPYVTRNWTMASMASYFC